MPRAAGLPLQVALGTRLQHLLETDPEMAALLAAGPQLGHILRSLPSCCGARAARPSFCLPGSVCTKPAVRGFTTVGLLGGLVLLYRGYAYA